LGGAIDHRADLYSLGVTLFELVTGRVPFSEGDVAYHHRHTAPPDPREHVEELPAEFAELILQLLEKAPDARCESAQEISERLKPLSIG
jgi:serine/threonine protein kinase